MKSTDPQAETSRNSTCKYLGHEWKKTAAANYRVCQRQKCRAAQRLQDGAWVSVLPRRTRQQYTMPQQHALF
ncbi:MAG TPA: hypothetical protein VK140_02675 [Ktedonobacteraceae bacterium]|nr:hypothetical protein [Ktedonobacteraceae bacterium]